MSTTPPSLIKQADYNLSQLSVNPYPGRGILLGRSLDGLRWLQVYWIMGRSENSRNRQFVVEDGVLKTRPLDLSKVKDPSLVIYSAMASLPPWHVVTNGDHTDTIMASLRQGQDYRAALRSREHEPDPPHFTPRIAGGIDASAGQAWLAILKSDPDDSRRSLRQFFEYEALPLGMGWCITTYQKDGNPLPSFSGEPRVLPLAGTPEQIRENLWAHLHPENRIALVVKEILVAGGAARYSVVNQYAPTAPAP